MLAVSTQEKQDIYQDDEDIISKLYGSGETVIDEKDYYLKPDADLARAITFEEFRAGVKEDLRAMFQQRKSSV